MHFSHLYHIDALNHPTHFNAVKTNINVKKIFAWASSLITNTKSLKHTNIKTIKKFGLIY